jgi:ketosteroid isomerase-like protein
MAEKGANSALVLELTEAFNEGDRERLARQLSDDAEIRTIRSELEGRPYIGPDGLREAFKDWDKEWEFVRFVLGEVHEREPFVVHDLHIQAKGKASGIELDIPIWMLWKFDGDRVVRLQSFSDQGEARREAGLDD